MNENNNKMIFTTPSSQGDAPLSSVPPMTDEELKKALNIPERNTEDYPDIPKERQLKAGSFLWKLNLLASGTDGNLQSLVWDFYDKLDDYLHLDLSGSSIELAKSLEYLKEYLMEHDNILFHDIQNPKTEETKI